MTHYDIIGDIHGHAQELEALLRLMGYEKKDGFYRHPERTAVFLGDFIDRGPGQREVIDIVRPMIDSGTAHAVMGNHEFNAICFATMAEDGKPIRIHGEQNLKQHKVFLEAYPYGSDDYYEIIEWFKTLPVYSSLDGIDVVHACWSPESIAVLEPLLNPDHTLSAEALRGYGRESRNGFVREGTAYFGPLEVLTKGPEIRLPDGMSFADPDGTVRRQARILWWKDPALPVAERLEISSFGMTDEQRRALGAAVSLSFNKAARPAFFGHYWLTGEPDIACDNAACVDFSVAKNGNLAAYRWSGEQVLSKNNFVWVPAV